MKPVEVRKQILARLSEDVLGPLAPEEILEG